MSSPRASNKNRLGRCRGSDRHIRGNAKSGMLWELRGGRA